MASDRLPEHWQAWFFPAVVLLFLILALEMYFSARLESQTFDEPSHLYAGYSYWLRSDFGLNPEHPPLVKLVASVPLLVARPRYPEPVNIYFRADAGIGGGQLLGAPGGETLLNRARVAVTIFVFLLAALVVFAGYEMFGQATALFALTLFAFDPLLVAHGPLLGTDVGAACFIFATVYAFYRYVRRPSLMRLGACAVAAGLALAAKHSAILIFPILFLLSVAEAAFCTAHAGLDHADAQGRPAESRGRCALRLGVALAAIFAVSIAILWAFYGFRYQARPNGGQITPPTAEYLKELRQPGEARAIAFAERHHLLPEAYLYGFTDITILSHEGRVMFLFGKVYPEGRWFYFPTAFVIKATIGFLLLLALLLFAPILRRSEFRRELLFLVVPAVFFFAAAMASKLNIGIRHVLPVAPFLIMLAAAGAVSLARVSRRWAWAVSILLALHVASSLRAFPNYLAYSNELFGGPNNTYRVLSDSNVGWGGGLKALHTYIEKKHVTQCWFAYSAFPDPADFQISCKQLPTYFSSLRDRGQQQPVPEQIEGPVFISSEELVGLGWGPDEMNPYQPFVRRRPDHIIAAEILEYDGTFDVKRIAAFSRYVVANALLQQKKSEEALAEAKMAVVLDPDSLDAHQTLAWAYAANHQKDDAAREYQAAVHLFQTVHPEFQNNRFPPEDPLAPPQH